ncbi:MAG: DUF1801 domain-containing protein [Candidatus Thiodiazotropha sp. (ex Monitilora ramsayi)]|nr:DUF1801 domain-containing protein [Candidatus Thiodiazotropha sp. (ex Monitilora ramsayi)]
MNATVEEYLAAVPSERQALVNQLHQLIIEICPDAEVDMSYKMPTYKSDDGWVALANQKHYVSLYTCGAHHLVEFKALYPKIKTGKGCINFKPGDALPAKALRQVIRHAMERSK